MTTTTTTANGQQGTRAKVSDAQIKAAIEAMAADGEKPSVRRVREERLGGVGSMNRINRILAGWREAQKPAEAAQAVLSETAQQTLADLLQRERSAAVAAKLEELADLKAELDDLAGEGEKLESEVENLTVKVEQMTAEAQQAAAVAQQQAMRIEQLEGEQQRLQAQAQQQTQELATALAKLDMQQQQHQQTQQRFEEAQARQQEQAAAVAQAQQAAAVAEAKLAAAVAAQASTQAAAQQAATAAAQRIERLEQQLEAAQKRADDAQLQRNADAQAHIKQITQRDEQLHTEHQKNAQLMSQIDQLSDKLKTAEAKVSKAKGA